MDELLTEMLNNIITNIHDINCDNVSLLYDILPNVITMKLKDKIVKYCDEINKKNDKLLQLYVKINPDDCEKIDNNLWNDDLPEYIIKNETYFPPYKLERQNTWSMDSIHYITMNMKQMIQINIQRKLLIDAHITKLLQQN